MVGYVDTAGAIKCYIESRIMGCGVDERWRKKIEQDSCKMV